MVGSNTQLVIVSQFYNLAPKATQFTKQNRPFCTASFWINKMLPFKKRERGGRGGGGFQIAI